MKRSIDVMSDAVAAKISRLSLVQLLTTLIVLAVASSLSVLAPNIVARYRESRMPVLMELENERLGRMAFELKEQLDMLTPKSFVANQTGIGMSLEDLQFPRFPRYGETFLSIRNGKMVRMSGTLDGKLAVDLSPFDFSLPKPNYGVFYVMTTFGELVSVSDKDLLPATGKIASRDVVKAFFQSGVDQNARIVQRDDGETLVSYRTVPGSNLVLFSEKPLTGLLSALNEMLASILIATLAAAFLVLVVSFFVIKVHLRPLSKIKVYAAALVSSGGKTTRAKPSVPETSEFAVIAESYAMLEKKAKRSESLAHAVVHYTRILQGFQRQFGIGNFSFTAERNAHIEMLGLVTATAELAMNLLQPLAIHRVYVFFRNPQRPGDSSLMIHECGLVGARVSLSAPQLSADPTAVGLLARYQNLSSPILDQAGVHIPILFQGVTFGLITIRNYPNALHYQMVEPHLAIAASICNERLATQERIAESFFREFDAFVARARDEILAVNSRIPQKSPPTGRSRRGGSPDPSDDLPDFAEGSTEFNETKGIGA